MLSMWIRRDYILVDILAGLPLVVGMFLAVWIVIQVLSNLLLSMQPRIMFQAVTYVLRSAEQGHEKEMKKLDIIHDEAKAVGKVAEYKAKMQVWSSYASYKEV